jgi:hypothetical protein
MSNKITSSQVRHELSIEAHNLQNTNEALLWSIKLIDAALRGSIDRPDLVRLSNDLKTLRNAKRLDNCDMKKSTYIKRVRQFVARHPILKKDSPEVKWVEDAINEGGEIQPFRIIEKQLVDRTLYVKSILYAVGLEFEVRNSDPLNRKVYQKIHITTKLK